MESSNSPAEHYRSSLESARTRLAEARAKWNRIGWLRGVTFLTALAFLFCGLFQVQSVVQPWFWIAGICFAGFLGIAFCHELLADTIRVCRMRVQMFRDATARIERRLKDVVVHPIRTPGSIVDASRDLDLIGPHSLHTLLASVHTREGIAMMTKWFGTHADPEEVVQRQLAARALKAQLQWREEFELLIRKLADSRAGRPEAEAPPVIRDEDGDSTPQHESDSVATGLVQWCLADCWLPGRRWVLWLARLALLTFLIVIPLAIAGVVPLVIAGPIMTGAFLVNFFLAVFFSGAIHDEFNQVQSGYGEVAVYARLFQMVDHCQASGGRLDSLRAEMFSGHDDVRREISRLGMLAWLASLRSGGLWFVPWLLMQFIGFYDVHVLVFLERWKLRHGHYAAIWFRSLGEWEVLAAMGRLAWDEPDWCWPRIVAADGKSDCLQAKEMGHPLIAAGQVVTNNVNVGPVGRFLLVTGSNMSGKSTLLRSIGLNVFLAQLGAPVFAREFAIPSLAVSTSMRVSDSLADGVSFFMAELKRLKSIVDRADATSHEKGRGHLFLLDEILQGTNSRERQIAVAAVVKSLTDAGSIGAISTHDLELASAAELSTRCDVVHFREHFEEIDGRKKMMFDYVMREGVSPTTNALKLLELVGLGHGKKGN